MSSSSYHHYTAGWPASASDAAYNGIQVQGEPESKSHLVNSYTVKTLNTEEKQQYFVYSLTIVSALSNQSVCTVKILNTL